MSKKEKCGTTTAILTGQQLKDIFGGTIVKSQTTFYIKDKKNGVTNKVSITPLKIGRQTPFSKFFVRVEHLAGTKFFSSKWEFAKELITIQLQSPTVAKICKMTGYNNPSIAIATFLEKTIENIS